MKFPSLEDMQKEVGKLHALLQDPHPGLFTWNEFINEQTQTVYNLLSAFGCGPVPELIEALKSFLDDLPDMTIVDGAGAFGGWMVRRITKAQAALAKAGALEE